MSLSNGEVVAMEIDHESEGYKEIGRIDTELGIPVLEMVVCPERGEIYCGAANGELYLLSKDLTKKSVISAHYCMIVRMLKSGNNLYTFG